MTGGLTLKNLDLGALTHVLAAPERDAAEDLAAPEGARRRTILEGSVSGTLAIDRAQIGALERAKARFAPTALTLARGGPRVVLRPTKDVIALDEDAVTIPPLVFDLQAGRGLKGGHRPRLGLPRHAHPGSRARDGAPRRSTSGLLVGVVPKLERATGTLELGRA